MRESMEEALLGLVRFDKISLSSGGWGAGGKQLGRRKLNNTVTQAGWLLGRYPCPGNQLRALDGCRDAKADGWIVVSRVEQKCNGKPNILRTTLPHLLSRVAGSSDVYEQAD